MFSSTYQSVSSLVRRNEKARRGKEARHSEVSGNVRKLDVDQMLDQASKLGRRKKIGEGWKSVKRRNQEVRK